MSESPSEGRGRRLLLEGATIVLSILLAFGIDALWDERRDTIAASEAIEQLKVDFRLNAARMDSVRTVHERALEASYGVLGLARSGLPPADTARAIEMIRYAITVWTYDPVLGGINSLVQSGRLGLIENDELRVAIAGWPDLVADLNEDEKLESANTFERLAPYMMSQGVLLDALLAVGSLSRSQETPDPGVLKILRDPLYEQMIGWRINGLENVLIEVDQVSAEIRRIRELLEEAS